MKTVIATTAAPGAIGPYSQAIEAGGFVFVSGQLPLDPATGAFVPGGVEAQTARILQVSQVQVSRLERRSLQKLRELLAEEGLRAETA